MNLNDIVGKRIASVSCEPGSPMKIMWWAAQMTFDDGSVLDIDIKGQHGDAWLEFEYYTEAKAEPETEAELGLSSAAGVTDKLAEIYYEVLVDSNQLEGTHAPTPYVPSPDRAWERPPPGHPEDAEGPWWAHGTRETNPHWPYEGPAQGWVQA